MTLTNQEIIKRIDRLQLLMLQTKPSLTCEWEVITVEKIKELFEKGLLSGGKHMKFLNGLYKDYKGRKELDGGEALSYRKWDLIFSEDKHDELMYKLRYEYLTDDKTAAAGVKLHDTKFKLTQIKSNLKDLGITFDDTDIMRIRITKKPGDLVMVENPFDGNHSFPAVVDVFKHDDVSTSIRGIRGKTTRCEIDWHKQNDKGVTGKSTITEYDINMNSTLFAEEVQNLT